MKVILGGDTHGQLDEVKRLMDVVVAKEADGLFVLGDFGIWDHADGGKFTTSVAGLAEQTGKKVWFLPGNHENYNLLDAWEKNNPRDEDGFVLIHDHLRYSPRGHRWTWGGVKFLSMGGAYSVDKRFRVGDDSITRMNAQRRAKYNQTPWRGDEYRLAHDEYSWWAREEITQEEADLASAGGHADVLLAHDKPLRADIPWNRKNYEACLPNQEKLQQVVDAVRPSLYCHGHFHYPYDTLIEADDYDCFVKGFDCDEGSSASSGGTGDFDQSWGLLDVQPVMEHGSIPIRLTWEDGEQGRSITVLKSPRE